jgi:hypothetical protein
VIQAGQGKYVDDAAGAAGAGVPGTEHEPPHTRVHYGRGAHHARLERHVERGIGQPVTAERLAGRAQHRDLCVRGGIVAHDRRIVAGGDDLLPAHQHRTHRHLATRGRGKRLPERHAHERGIAARLS